MTENKTEDYYQEQLEKLHSGELDEIVIRPDQFMVFQRAYREYPNHNQIVGSAKHGGEIHYHLETK